MNRALDWLARHLVGPHYCGADFADDLIRSLPVLVLGYLFLFAIGIV